MGPRTVHPRACGEYVGGSSGFIGVHGSPPRLRGILSGRYSAYPQNSVHPRACGEYRACFAVMPPSTGSPPRLRGILTSRAPPTARRSVHPRACGEYRLDAERLFQFRGSPPRLRGILTPVAIPKCAARFTPAPAGNTRSTALPGPSAPVHPRACGEYLKSKALSDPGNGSPPRLRGIQKRLCGPVSPVRFTPAPAGNTTGGYGPPTPGSVHPRACGEYESWKAFG